MHHSFKVGTPLLICVQLWLALPSFAQSLFPADYFRSEQFKRAYLGTLGVKTDIEPKLNEQEQYYLEQIEPHLSEDPKSCIDAFNKIVSKDGTARFDYELGMLHFQKGDMAGAETHLKNAVTKFDRFLRAHTNLGLLYTRQNKTRDAIPHLTRALSLGQADEQLFGLLAFCHMANGNALSAESAYRNAIMLGPKTLDWKTGLAQALFTQQKASEAVALLDELIKDNPQKEMLWSMQALAYLANKQPLKAAENFEMLAMQEKATAKDLNTLGDIYLNEGVFTLATAAYAKTLTTKDAPTTPEPLLRAADLLAQRAAYPQVKQLLDSVDTAFPKMDDSLRLRALKTRSRVAMAEDAPEQALGILKEIVNTNPLDGEALMLLADHYNKQGNDEAREQSIFYLERALKVSAVEADASVRLAQGLMSKSARETDKLKRIEHLQRAIELLKRAQELKPRDSVGRYLTDLERVLVKARGA